MSKPFETRGKLSLIGLKMDSVTLYNRIINFPLVSCGTQLINTLILNMMKATRYVKDPLNNMKKWNKNLSEKYK